MEEKIKITDTKDKTEITIGNTTLPIANVLDYEIKRFDGKSRFELYVTFSANELETKIDI